MNPSESGTLSRVPAAPPPRSLLAPKHSLLALSSAAPHAYACRYNPHFKNAQKTCEPWLLHDYAAPFYGATLRILAVAYIRPEAPFSSLEALVERIHEDGRIARQLCGMPAYAELSADAFLVCS